MGGYVDPSYRLSVTLQALREHDPFVKVSPRAKLLSSTMYSRRG